MLNALSIGVPLLEDILGYYLVLFVWVFFVMFFYIERNWLLMRNLVTILPLKSKLSGKYQRFNAIDRSIKMLKIIQFSKTSIKTENCKTFYKAQTASHLKEIIQPPPYQIKPYPFLRRYKEIYRHFLSMCFKNAVLGCQEMVQYKYLFWHQTETCL